MASHSSDTKHAAAAASNDPHAPDPHELEHLEHHIKTYIGVFVALLVLTAITVGVAYLPFSATGHIVVALLIATIKAGLVALYFMHLVSEKKTVIQIIIASMVCAFFLFGLTWLAWYNPITWGKDPYKSAGFEHPIHH
ncbi:MAG: cytochrome C oxidase subunit IV family protein [Candidatus Methylacidiphilales bacterium]|nr:cytochrome C oxidase subunit IV family protein [Candidatus Methylacidiphilales bacterium]